ncbi:hypothetical protein BU26DRAFT_538853 [Trematosphaeria pertusa]|uniref:SRP9 domain-containing protein n=1 Tax=Trematosphaeria pertusa TaxID=390896 RepID=A0A6A6IP67_9PLEO|nr:uncharacterized protein BU26DRAFT_538853 [Trematosphaeria pertusa]KAF2252017.1 hypothetical protein BU26DRAFT_538853 [Trematosphaeria pertusa]
MPFSRSDYSPISPAKSYLALRPAPIPSSRYPTTAIAMPYFKTSTEWYEQSSLLLKARPTTTRITSKYTVLKPTPSKIKKRQKYLDKQAAKLADPSRTSSPPPSSAQNPEEPTTTFALKTYDPESGTCLQYETTKAAEVGRLIGSLGRLGRHMAALPEVLEDLSAPAEGTGLATPRIEDDIKVGGMGEGKAGGTGGGGGGGKKKKKGKK